MKDIPESAARALDDLNDVILMITGEIEMHENEIIIRKAKIEALANLKLYVKSRIGRIEYDIEDGKL